MARPVSTKDHRKFCEIDGWEEIKSVRGKGSHHIQYKKTLPNGEVTHTRISRDTHMEYSRGLWGKIWKTQLQLENEEDFWEALRTNTPAQRLTEESGQEAAIPEWVVQGLKQTAGMRSEEIEKLSPEAAEALLYEHYGMNTAEPDIDDLTLEELEALTRPDLPEMETEMQAGEKPVLSRTPGEMKVSGQEQEIGISGL